MVHIPAARSPVPLLSDLLTICRRSRFALRNPQGHVSQYQKNFKMSAVPSGRSRPCSVMPGRQETFNGGRLGLGLLPWLKVRHTQAELLI